MLRVIGVDSVDALYRNVPKNLRVGDGLNLPHGMSELETRREISALAGKNTVFSTCLRGAGSYRHFIPAAVKSVVTREEFVTAYTPYQAEVSQGILQAIFEYQTMMCELTGLDVSNAGVYDGGTAAAESITMCRDRKRVRACVSGTVNPDVLATMKTYCFGSDVELNVIPAVNGRTDPEALRDALRDDAACFYLQQPNYFGLLEDARSLGEITHAAGAKFVMGVHPIALAVIRTPAECGADVAVGEGQPLGMDTAFGGPYLGFMTASRAMMRKLPGRIVGRTTDAGGQTGYVLTLSAREQHIRREKASSNICSNQQLCALTAAVYLSAMGGAGLRQAAVQSMSKAHYFAAQLAEKLGWRRIHDGEFFHEFVSECPCPVPALSALRENGILGGLPVEGGILWCVTELVSRREMDRTISILQEVKG
jgi:glycine dehydrogenase subunit 1